MSINIEKQKKYWYSGAENDVETAAILIEKSKLLEGLFFCHLAIEKALKAHVVQSTKDIPPKTHNLIRLAELTNLSLENNRIEFFGEMMNFHLEGRYPDNYKQPPEKDEAVKYLAECEEVVTWLIKRL